MIWLNFATAMDVISCHGLPWAASCGAHAQILMVSAANGVGHADKSTSLGDQ